MRYRLCDDEEDVSGIAVELAIQAEPFADEVPYRLALHARRRAGGGGAGGRADAGRAVRARPRAARRRRGRVRPFRARPTRCSASTWRRPACRACDQRGRRHRLGGRRQGARRQADAKRRRRPAGARRARGWRWLPRASATTPPACSRPDPRRRARRRPAGRPRGRRARRARSARRAPCRSPRPPSGRPGSRSARRRSIGNPKMPVEIAGKAIDAMPRSPATSTDRRWAEASFASSVLLAAVPDRPDRVDHVAGRQPARGRRLGIAHAAPAEQPALLEDRRAAGAVDRAVHAATAEQRAVGRVDDGVHLDRRDVALDQRDRNVHRETVARARAGG